MADAPHSKCGIERCVGSSPTSGTAYPLVRGVFAFKCVQSWTNASASRPRDGAWPPGAACLVWWGNGFSVLAGGRSAGSQSVSRGFLLRFCLVGLGWPTPLRGVGDLVRHDFERLLFRRSVPWDFRPIAAPTGGLSGQRGCVHCAHPSLFVSDHGLLTFLPSLVHPACRHRRHDLPSEALLRWRSVSSPLSNCIPRKRGR